MMNVLVFTPEHEMDKAINAIKSDASGTSCTVNDADAIIKQKFTNDDSLNGGGFFAVYFKKAGVKVQGLRSVSYKGGTLLTTFCTPDRVKGHYKDVKYFKDAKMGVAIYSTPKNLEILSEQM